MPAPEAPPAPDAPPAVVHPSSFSSRDADEVTEFIRQTYVGNRSRFAPDRDHRASFEAVAATSPGVACSQVRSTIDYRTATDPFDSYLFFVVRGGQVRVRAGRDETRLQSGDGTFYPLQVPLTVEVADVSLQILQLPIGRLDQVAEEVAGIPAGGLRFHGTTPVSPAMGGYWRSVVGLVTGALLAEDPPLSSPLIAEEMARLAAMAALHVFANSTLTGDVPGPGWTGPAALRRAVAYIDANADRPVTLAEVAAAAGTGTRALQYAFRRHHGTTPLGYARRVRLDRAHGDLRAADPTRGDTVAAIAARWGFAKPDRFAAAYRDAYGVLPSSTLRSG